MKDGDRNTKFFHECASQRKRKNEISRLRNQYGDWVSDKTKMEGMVNNYFNNLFISSNPAGIPNVVSLVDRVVSDDMNQKLVRDLMQRKFEEPYSKSILPRLRGQTECQLFFSKISGT
jgi:hypothetical protein